LASANETHDFADERRCWAPLLRDFVVRLKELAQAASIPSSETSLGRRVASARNDHPDLLART
jgi:hypothetical protein